MTKRSEDYSQLDELQVRMLKYIYQVLHHPTRRDIEAYFFPDLKLGAKTRYVERRLEYLVEHKYIKYQTLEKDKHPTRERGYYLLVKGARAIGVELKRSHSKVQKKKYYEARKAKTEIAALAHRRKWQITAGEEAGQRILISHIQHIIYREGQREPLEADVRSIIPRQIKPDLVIKTAREVIICTITHPAGEAQYFSRREEKYRDCKRFFKFLIITINKRQWINAIRSLRGECGYIGELEEKGIYLMENVEAKTFRFLILTMEQISQIPDLL